MRLTFRFVQGNAAEHAVITQYSKTTAVGGLDKQGSLQVFLHNLRCRYRNRTTSYAIVRRLRFEVVVRV